MTYSAQPRAENYRTMTSDLAAQINWTWLPALTKWVIDQCIKVQQVPAPTFDEAKRADYIAAQYQALGLENIWIDDWYNVYGLMPGKVHTGPGVMLSAHSDTVFAAGVDLTIRREDDRIYGPGIGDNSMGIAGMLGIARGLQMGNITPPVDLHFVATTREEGLGNLDGMRAAYTHIADSIGAVINMEGLALGFVYNAGIAVRRLKITAKADGGHSWVHFGKHNAINGLIELGARLLRINPPNEPRTTYNIGMIEGGQAINALATEAALWLDMRSESPAELVSLERRVRTFMDEIKRDDLRFEVEIVGDRPAGELDPSHPLVQFALASLEVVSFKGGLHSGSTDGNIPLQAGCPAVTIGVTSGANAHRVDEYIELEPVEAGLKQLILLTLLTSEHITDF